MRRTQRSYRQSHVSKGYGLRYEETYSNDYYFYQWKYLEEPIVRRIFQNLKESGARNYLDFACGTGRILRVGEAFFERSTGVDVSETMLQWARRNCGKSTLLKIDLTRDSLDSQFDVITAFRFFLNAEPELRAQALNAIHSLLRSDGVFVSNIHVNRSSVLGYFYRMRNRLKGRVIANTESYAGFSGDLAAHGFRVVDVHWYSFLPRFGRYVVFLPKYLMTPVEWVCTNLRIPKSLAQGFILICRKNGRREGSG